MFGIGSWEFLLIALLALLLFGPDKLPEFARTIGRLVRDFKRYTDMMESTFRAEIYADPRTRQDPFKKGKEFREQVQAGAYVDKSAAEGEESGEEAGGESSGEASSASGQTDGDVVPEVVPEDSTADATEDAAEDAPSADAPKPDELPADHPLHDARAAGEDIGVDDDVDLASLDPADLGWVPGQTASPTSEQGEGVDEDEA